MNAYTVEESINSKQVEHTKRQIFLKKHQDPEYCPICKKAIVNALSKIEICYANKFRKTDEVTLQQLEDWEEVWEAQEELDEATAILNGEVRLPIAELVFPSLVNSVTGATRLIKEVKGRDKYEGCTFRYSYWPDNKKDANIYAEKYVDLETDEEIHYTVKKQ